MNWMGNPGPGQPVHGRLGASQIQDPSLDLSIGLGWAPRHLGP